METITCSNCKKEFKDYLSNNRKYCGRHCYKISAKNQIPWNKGLEQWKDVPNPWLGKKHSKETKLLMKKNNGMKGKTPWNKGKRQWSDKDAPMKGRKHSLETRRKISKSLKGKFTKENNPAWKGGVQSESRLMRVRFRKTIQKEVLKRDDYTCQLCGERGGKLQVDHIQPWSEYVELRFSMDNCRTVCQGCHYEITFGKPMPKTVKTWGHNLVQLERRSV